MINKRSFLGLPMTSRRPRRYLVACYWGVILLLVAFASWWMERNPNWTHHSFLLPLSYFSGLLLVFLGGGRPGGPVRDFAGRPMDRPELLDNTIKTLINSGNRDWVEEDRRLDERDIRARDAAHYRAYSAIRWIVLFGSLGALVLFSNAIAARLTPLIAPLIWLFVLIVFNLPQSIILWTEPDIEEQP
jgi:hypothetical protein